VPHEPVGVVVFASVPALADDKRDAHIIAALYELRMATVYVPLLTEDEIQFDSRTTHFRYDADFLAQRYIVVHRDRRLDHVRFHRGPWALDHHGGMLAPESFGHVARPAHG